MSTILKALRRLEEEKQERALERDLREAVAGGRPRPAHSGGAWRRGALAVAALAVFLGSLAALGWVWLGRGDSVPQGAAAPVSAGAPEAPPARRTSPAPRRIAAESMERRAPVAAPPTRPTAEPPRARASTPPPSPPAPAVRSPEPVVESIAVEDLPVAPPQATRSEPSAPETGAARVVRLHRPEVAVPTVERTVWHPDASRRSALVAVAGEATPREIRQGEAVDGFTAVEIKPGGVTFQRDGVIFDRGVGER